jgi:hypothetical protein
VIFSDPSLSSYAPPVFTVNGDEVSDAQHGVRSPSSGENRVDVIFSPCVREVFTKEDFGLINLN